MLVWANVSNMMPLTPFLEIEKKGLIDYESSKLTLRGENSC